MSLLSSTSSPSSFLVAPFKISSKQLLSTLEQVFETTDLSIATPKSIREELEQQFQLKQGTLLPYKKQFTPLLTELLIRYYDQARSPEAQPSSPIVRSNGANGHAAKSKQSSSKSASTAAAPTTTNRQQKRKIEKEEVEIFSDSEEENLDGDNDDEEDDDDDEEYTTAKPATTTVRKSTANKNSKAASKNKKKQPPAKRGRKRRKVDDDDDDDSDMSEYEDDDDDDDDGHSSSVDSRLTKLKELARIVGISLVKPTKVSSLSPTAAITYLTKRFKSQGIDCGPSALTKQGMEKARLHREIRELKSSALKNEGGFDDDDDEREHQDSPSAPVRRSSRARPVVRYQSDDEDVEDEDMETVLESFGLTVEEAQIDPTEAKRKKEQAEQRREEKKRLVVQQQQQQQQQQQRDLEEKLKAEAGGEGEEEEEFAENDGELNQYGEEGKRAEEKEDDKNVANVSAADEAVEAADPNDEEVDVAPSKSQRKQQIVVDDDDDDEEEVQEEEEEEEEESGSDFVPDED